MRKYQPLYERLAASPGDEWRASFSELEAVLGFPLPKAARSSRAWWGNDPGKSHSRTWAAQGWEVGDVDHAAERVVFRRGAASGATLAAAAHLQPLRDAAAVEGPAMTPAPGAQPVATPPTRPAASGEIQPPAMKEAAETASARMRANRTLGGAALAAAAAAMVTGLGAWALRATRQGRG